MQEYDKELFKRTDSLNDFDENSHTKIFNKTVDISSNGNSNENYTDMYSSSVSFENEEENLKNRKHKKEKKRLPVGIKILIILMISFVLAGGIIFAGVEMLGISLKEPVSVEIEIKQGSSSIDIAEVLEEKGVIRSPLLFRAYVKLTGANGFQYGVYEVSSNSGYSDIISKLSQPGDIGDAVTVTIPEGYSVKKIAELMEENGVCSKTEFIKSVKYTDFDFDFIKDIPEGTVYYRLEGYLYPDTYQFFKATDEENGQEYADKAVKKMLQKTAEIITPEIKATAKKKGYSVHEILTMASIVELEANGYPDEMKNVAQVFYNRLRWTNEPNFLGSTPTSEYPDSRYDTNKNQGLPPGPLCSPSVDAINASLNPNTSLKADYFVTDKNMKFYYTESLSEHNELIERLKSEGLWN